MYLKLLVFQKHWQVNNRQVSIVAQYMINSSPWGDTDVAEINEVIDRLAERHNMQLIAAHHVYYNKYGELIDRYYSRDCIHLSESGVKGCWEPQTTSLK